MTTYKGYMYLFGNWHYIGMEIAPTAIIAKIRLRKRIAKKIKTAVIRIQEYTG